MERARETYDTVLEQYPLDFGKALSKKERQEKSLPHTTLIYGEIDFDSFGILVALCHFICFESLQDWWCRSSSIFMGYQVLVIQGLVANYRVEVEYSMTLAQALADL